MNGYTLFYFAQTFWLRRILEADFISLRPGSLGARGVNASLPQARLLCRPAVICRGGSAATGHLRFWELLGIFWDFLREARRFSARFWLRLSAQQHPHLNRTRKSQLAISSTSAPSAHLNRLSKSQLTLSNTSVTISTSQPP